MKGLYEEFPKDICNLLNRGIFFNNYIVLLLSLNKIFMQAIKLKP